MAEPVDPIVVEVRDLLAKGVSIPSRAGVTLKTGWDDAKLTQLAGEIKLPSSPKTLVNHPGLLLNFFNFYFNGTLPPGTSPHQVLFPILSLLVIEEDDSPTYFFPNEYFSDTGFYKVADIPARPHTLEMAQTGGMVDYTLPMGLTAEQVTLLRTLYLEHTAILHIDFLGKIKPLISNYNTNVMTPNNYMILRLAGFLSLLLFRGIAKDAIQLARGVNKKLIKDHVHSLAEWPVANGYAPPCKNCIENCVSDLDKGNDPPKRMITLLLNRWKDIESEARQARGLIPRIQATILTHTAGNGLGLVIMMFMAVEIIGMTITDLAEYTLTEKSKSSWVQLAKFVSTYMNPDNPQKTYLWARLVHDGYFADFAARSHPYLAGMFAGIIDSQQTVGTIKEAAWFKLKRVSAEAGYIWGTAVMSHISKTKDTAMTARAVAISKILPTGETTLQQVDQDEDPFADIEMEH